MHQVLGQKRILITGATGLIGQPLVHRLLAEGAEVTLYTRRPDVANSIFANCDLHIVSSLAGLAEEEFFGVVNLAGAPIVDKRWTHSRKAELLDSRVKFTRQLMSALGSAAGAPRVVISGSAIGYYGDTGEEAMTEDGRAGEGFAAQLCRDWEAAAREFEAAGVRVCCLRTGIVLAPGGGALARMLLPFRMGVGGPIGRGQQWMSWIHREDLIDMILWLLTDEAIAGPVNGVAPNPIRNREFSRTLANCLRRPSWLPVPPFLLRLLLGQAAQELLLSSNRVVPERALAAGFNYRYQNLSDAIDECL